MTITEFLLEWIAEDEAEAREIEDHGGWDAVRDDTRLEWRVEADSMGVIAATGYVGNCDAEPLARHIARWDPARVLAECKAKRAIVEMASRAHVRSDGEWVLLNEAYLRALASVYADHAEFRQEWAPVSESVTP